jgi:hypothetical protein
MSKRTFTVTIEDESADRINVGDIERAIGELPYLSARAEIRAIAASANVRVERFSGIANGDSDNQAE